MGIIRAETLALVEDDSDVRSAFLTYYEFTRNIKGARGFDSIAAYINDKNRPFEYAIVDMGLTHCRIDRIDYTVLMLVQLMLRENTKVCGITGQPGYERFGNLGIPIVSAIGDMLQEPLRLLGL